MLRTNATHGRDIDEITSCQSLFLGLRKHSKAITASLYFHLEKGVQSCEHFYQKFDRASCSFICKRIETRQYVMKIGYGKYWFVTDGRPTMSRICWLYCQSTHQHFWSFYETCWLPVRKERACQHQLFVPHIMNTLQVYIPTSNIQSQNDQLQFEQNRKW